MRNDLVVVKIGGRALEAPDASRELAAEVAAFPGAMVLVHGGGAEVSAWSERMGLAPRFVDGLRVTDAATLEVATAVLAGLANKRLVAGLRERGVDAVGLSALDGGTIEVGLHPSAGELGEVGAVHGVRPALIESLLAAGRVPVVASIGDRDGRLLNLNADDVAVALAQGLGARALVLLSDAPGVRLGDAFVSELDGPGVTAALAGEDVQGGMRAKLHAAQSGIAGGIGEIWIAAWQGAGTLAALNNRTAVGTRIHGGRTAGAETEVCA